MKGVLVLLSCFLPFPLFAVPLYAEYNTWYYQNGVLYDVTQTSASEPVLISISQAGFTGANMVVSLYAEGKCPPAGSVKTLKINSTAAAARYSCDEERGGRIEHYAVSDAKQVNELFENLRAQFTVVLQDDIKVWAANINQPRYGLAPGM